MVVQRATILSVLFIGLNVAFSVWSSGQGAHRSPPSTTGDRDVTSSGGAWYGAGSLPTSPQESPSVTPSGFRAGSPPLRHIRSVTPSGLSTGVSHSVPAGVSRSISHEITWHGMEISSGASSRSITPSEDEMLVTNWVVATMSSMTLEEKIGQLIIMGLPCNPREYFSQEQRQKLSLPLSEDVFTYAQRMVKDHHVGGILWIGQGAVVQQVKATNELQALSKIPLLIAQDFEPGLVRLPELIQLPWALTIGACSNTDMAFFVGQELARRAKRLGVHMICAPVADVYSNPNNPVVHYRSFGQNPDVVTQCALKLASGIQESGLLACGKHFPGHGDTGVDSHAGLPVVDRKKSEWLGSSKLTLENTELPPFKALIKAGIAAIMTGHIVMPQLNSIGDTGLPASLSRSVVNMLARDFEFGGLVVTDALNMGALSNIRRHALAQKYGKSEDEFVDSAMAAVLALRAGNDIVLYPTDIPRVIEAIKKAINDGTLREQDIDAKVSKILFAKAYLGLHHSNSLVSTEHILDDLNTKEVTDLVQTVYENAITLVWGNRVPFEGSKTAVVSVDGCCDSPFVKALTDAGASFLALDTKSGMSDVLAKQLASYETVVVYLVTDRKVRGLPNEGVASSHSPEAACSAFVAVRSSCVWGVDSVVSQMLKKISQTKRLVVVLFGSPHSARAVPRNQNTTVIWACEDVPEAQRVAAEVVCGTRQPRGVVPVELDDRFSTAAAPACA